MYIGLLDYSECFRLMARYYCTGERDYMRMSIQGIQILSLTMPNLHLDVPLYCMKKFLKSLVVDHSNTI